MIALALAAALTCTAPDVHDGDTLRCAGQRVRLWGVDAPETSGSPRCRYDRGWACGEAMRWADAAGARLRVLTRGQVTCTPVDQDRFGRIVARCEAGGLDLGGELVREGLARDYTRFSRGRYLPQETRARREHVGMWKGDDS